MPRRFSNAVAVWPGLFAVSMGLMAVLPTLPLYVEERFGLTDPKEIQSWAAIAFGAAPFAAAVMGPFWGVLGDRMGKKPMVVRATVAIGVVMALMPLAETPLQLTLLRVLQGAFAGYIAPAMALGTATTPIHRQGRVIGNLQTALAVGTLAGPVLGAEIAAWLGRPAVFYVSSILAFVAALPVVLWTKEVTVARSDRPGLLADFRSSAAGLIKNRVFLGLVGLLLLLRAGQHMVEPSVALFVGELGSLDWLRAGARDAEHAIDRTVGLAFALLAIAQIVTTPLWGRLSDRVGPLRCLSALAIGLAAATAATALLVDDIRGFMLWRAVGAIFMAGGMTLAYASASRRVAPERKTLAFAVVQSAMQFGMSLGPPFGVALAQRLDSSEGMHRSTLYGIAAATLALAALGMLVLRVFGERRNVPTPPGSSGT